MRAAAHVIRSPLRISAGQDWAEVHEWAACRRELAPSAPAAAVAGSSARALRLVMEQPQLRSRVLANSRYLRAGLRDLGFDVSEELTAYFGVSFGSAEEMKQVHEALETIRKYVQKEARAQPTRQLQGDTCSRSGKATLGGLSMYFLYFCLCFLSVRVAS